jgi:energy-coupling factor transporter ATP-binding protein EcfA2
MTETMKTPEKINNYFKLPIFYNNKKEDLQENIIKDLELVSTVDPSCQPIYYYAFNPKTILGEKVMSQITQHYTTDVTFLKESQELIRTFKSSNQTHCNDILSIWEEIKYDNGFKERYQYVDWPTFYHLNESELFLQLMSTYSILAPVISLIVPFIMLIIPFFMIQLRGVRISMTEYVSILKEIWKGHSMGKLFTKMRDGTVEVGEKIYIAVSASIYLFSIYQNIIMCIKFHQNMTKIHSHLKAIAEYLNHTIEKMENYLVHAQHYKTMNTFNAEVLKKHAFLKSLAEKLERITPYTLRVKKIGELGKIMKYFYELHNDAANEEAILYSFGFNGYIECLEGLSNQVREKKLQYAKFKKGSKTTFKKAYYPTLINDKPVKNSVKLDKNMIVTGPNASGKTTILKTTLINVILSQQFGVGFYDSATMNPYHHIHCYLNIPDTSGRDSLFQAEARRCKEILDDIERHGKKESHFCIFDELYSGTNPEDAVISANAFLNYLFKFKHVDCMLTTHFVDLCKKQKESKNADNYQMKTEKAGKNFKYTYVLEKGISEIRGGVKVLDDMNYPKEIIDATY